MLGFIILTLALLFFFVINIGVLLWAMSILGSWKAPYVPLPHESLPGIVEALGITAGSVVYDIGCGDGRILRAACAKHQDATYKGIERAWYPYILAKLCGKNPRITYVRGDACAQNYADADRIVLYLLPGFVDKIAQKIVEDCKEGTRVVAVDFPITFWEPEAAIEQKNLPAYLRGRMLYTYECKKSPENQ